MTTRRQLLSGLAGLTGLGLVAGAAGCTSSGSGDGGSATAYTYRMRDQYRVWLNDLKWFPVLQEKTGITTTLVDGGPSSQYYQKVDLALASGSIEDALIANGAQADIYGSQGAFADLAPLIAEHAPNIKAYIDANPSYQKLITSNGKVFGLAMETVKISNVTFYRSDMFDKAGITDLPTEVTALREALATLKQAYQKTADFYPFTGRETFLRFPYAFGAAFGIVDGKVNGIADDVVGALTSDGYRAMVEWYRSLYADGLIDPEFVKGASTEESWQTKMLTGKGAVSDDFFTRPSWFTNNGGPDNDPKFDLKVLQPFTLVDGTKVKVPAGARWDVSRELCLNAKTAKDKAPAILKQLDYLYGAEGQTLMHYGVEGESYQLKNGKPEYTVKFEDEGNKGDGVPVWNFLQDRLTFVAPVDNDAYQQWMDPQTREFSVDYFANHLEQRPVLKYSVDDQKKRSDLMATLQAYVLAQVTAFVSGDRAMADWDAFLGEAEAKGFSQVKDLDQAAYEAANG